MTLGPADAAAYRREFAHGLHPAPNPRPSWRQRLGALFRRAPPAAKPSDVPAMWGAPREPAPAKEPVLAPRVR